MEERGPSSREGAVTALIGASAPDLAPGGAGLEADRVMTGGSFSRTHLPGPSVNAQCDGAGDDVTAADPWAAAMQPEPQAPWGAATQPPLGADRGNEWWHQQPDAEQRGQARTGAPYSRSRYGSLVHLR